MDLTSILEPTCRTLRRLCISYAPVTGPDEPWRPVIDNYDIPIRSLARFSHLDDLAIDYRFLYRVIEDEEEDWDVLLWAVPLVRILPATIRRLRITYVIGDMTMSLTELAYNARRRFPELATVTVGVYGMSHTEDPFWLEEMISTVGPVFEAKGIKIVWTEEALGASIPTTIPDGAKPGRRLLPWYEDGPPKDWREQDHQWLSWLREHGLQSPEEISC